MGPGDGRARSFCSGTMRTASGRIDVHAEGVTAPWRAYYQREVHIAAENRHTVTGESAAYAEC